VLDLIANADAESRQPVGIQRVDDIDMMPFVRQGVRQSPYVDGVPTDVVGRIVRGEQAEVQRVGHWTGLRVAKA